MGTQTSGVAPPRAAAARAARGDAAQKGHGDGADADAACFGGAAWIKAFVYIDISVIFFLLKYLFSYTHTELF